MARKNNQQRRRLAEERSRAAAVARRAAARDARNRDALVRSRLREARRDPPSIAHLIAVGAWERLPAPVLDAWYQAGLPIRANQAGRHRLVDLLQSVHVAAPRLASVEWFVPLARLAEAKWVARANAWTTGARSPERAFAELVQHLMGGYGVPSVLVGAFDVEEREDARRLGNWAARIAAGDSAFAAARSTLPVRPTRREVHAILQSPRRGGPIRAIRKAQLRSVSAPPAMFAGIEMSDLVRRLRSPAQEAFLPAVLGWLAGTGGVRAVEVPAIVGRLLARREADPEFRVKGRSLRAVRADVARYVRESSATAGRGPLPEAAFAGGAWTHARASWTLEQLVSPSAFIAEGRALRHCVFTYLSVAERGRSTLWSLRRNGERALTVEVNKDRRVVQVRGLCNRAPKPEELEVLRTWAGEQLLFVARHL